MTSQTSDFLSDFASRFAQAQSLAAQKAAFFEISETFGAPHPQDVQTRSGLVEDHPVAVFDVTDLEPDGLVLYLPSSLSAGAPLAHSPVAAALAAATGLRVVLPDLRLPETIADAINEIANALLRTKPLVLLGDGIGAHHCLTCAAHLERDQRGLSGIILVPGATSLSMFDQTNPNLAYFPDQPPEYLWHPNLSPQTAKLWLDITMNAAAFARGLLRR